MRIAQDVGAHRRKAGPLTVEGELWKRAWWVLVGLDRMMSSSKGRPCAVQDEEYVAFASYMHVYDPFEFALMVCFSFDVDLPVECDDEYMEHPDPQQRFKQPAGKPSVISFFLTQIKLMRLLSFCLRTIVRITSRMLF